MHIAQYLLTSLLGVQVSPVPSWRILVAVAEQGADCTCTYSTLES